MRLGQFARKYDIRVQDIISYLEGSENDIHSNTKLTDEDENDILDFFGIEKEAEPEPIIEESIEENVPDTSEESEDEDAWIEQDSPQEEIEKKESVASQPLPATPEEDIALAEGELDFMPAQDDQNEDQEKSEEQTQEVKAEEEPEKKVEPREDEVIDTERLMELLESEEEVPELEKIKLIKASKKELSGLKVLGKVELPEPKKKEEKSEEEESDQTEKKSSRPERNNRRNRPSISEEENEKRRLRAKRKKEEFEAREAKRQKDREERELKEKRVAHYKQQLAKPKVAPPKKKVKKQLEAITPTSAPTKPAKKKAPSKPTTALGKVWKWLTNPDQ